MEWEVGQLPTDPLLYTQLQLPWMMFQEEQCMSTADYWWEYRDDTDVVQLLADGLIINCQQTTTTTTNINNDDEYASSIHITGSKVNKQVSDELELELEFEEVRKYFDKPISVAAKELRTGLTLFKKRCRKLGINRWPHRKFKSLDSLIRNLNELGMVEEVSILEGQRRLLQNRPHMDLNDRAKKIRQKSFKANYHSKSKTIDRTIGAS